jgi:hypothetical protein
MKAFLHNKKLSLNEVRTKRIWNDDKKYEQQQPG